MDQSSDSKKSGLKSAAKGLAAARRFVNMRARHVSR